MAPLLLSEDPTSSSIPSLPFAELSPAKPLFSSKLMEIAELAKVRPSQKHNANIIIRLTMFPLVAQGLSGRMLRKMPLKAFAVCLQMIPVMTICTALHTILLSLNNYHTALFRYKGFHRRLSRRDVLCGEKVISYVFMANAFPSECL